MGTTVQRKYTLDLLKVLLCVGIVVRHAELVGMVDRSAAFAGFNRGMMLFTELCVPMFFVISGYLFFLNVPEKPNGRYFVNKIRSRVFTLLVPYLYIFFFFEKMSVQILCPFFIGLFGFLLLLSGCMSSLRILNINHLSDK